MGNHAISRCRGSLALCIVRRKRGSRDGLLGCRLESDGFAKLSKSLGEPGWRSAQRRKASKVYRLFTISLPIFILRGTADHTGYPKHLKGTRKIGPKLTEIEPFFEFPGSGMCPRCWSRLQTMRVLLATPSCWASRHSSVKCCTVP